MKTFQRFRRSSLKLGILALVMISAPSISLAAPDVGNKVPLGYLGGMLGLSSVNNGVGTGLGFGLQGAYFLNEKWGVGAFLRAANHNANISSFFYAAQALYRLDDFVPHLLAGGTLGAGRFSFSGNTGNSALLLGLLLAYDHPVSTQHPITVGGEFSVGFTEPGSTMLTILSPMVTAKWWF